MSKRFEVESESLDNGETYTVDIWGDDDGEEFRGQIVVPMDLVQPLRDELNDILLGVLTPDSFPGKIPGWRKMFFKLREFKVI